MHLFLKHKNRYRLADRFILLLAALLFLLIATPASAYDVVIAWDPNSEQNLAGYVLYVDDGTTQMPYEYVDDYPLQSIDPQNPRAKITDLQEGIAYYFVVTAYDTDGNESGYSNEVCIMNGQQCSSNTASVGGGGGGGGGGCFIAAAGYDPNNDGGPALLLLMLLAAAGITYVFAFTKSTTT